MVDPVEVAIFKAAIKDETAKFWTRMDRRLSETESQGKKAFESLEKQIRVTGQATGELANSKTKGFGAVVTKGILMASVIEKGIGFLINQFKNLAIAGVKALSRILEKGNEINAGLETAERTFAAVFDDPALGKETIKFLTEVSSQLGINRAQAIDFARSILPRTDSAEQFARVLELTTAQARATGVEVDELGFSVREALAGDPALLRDRFDLDRSQIALIKELTGELGAAGAFVKVIGDELESRGIANLQDFADTGSAVRQSLSAIFDDLQAQFAAPIFEAQTQSLTILTDALNEDKTLIVTILQDISEVGASLIETLTKAGIALREQIDLERLRELTASFDDLFDVIVLFVDTLVGGSEGAGDSINTLIDIVDRLVKSLVAGAEKVARIGATIRIMSAAIRDVAQALGAVFITDDIDAFRENIEQLSESALFSDKALAKEVDNIGSAMDRFSSRVEENKKKQEERAKASKDASKADTDAIDDALAGLNKTEAKATDAQKAVLKLQQDLTKKFVEDQIKESRRITDAEIKESRRREDIARDSIKALAKIEADASEARTEAFADFGQDVAEFEQEASDERRQIREDAQESEAAAERAFRQKLRDIQTNFERSARDAALANDSEAFINAKIQRQDALADARADRTKEKSEIRSEASSKVQELKKDLAKERDELDKDLRERLDKIDQSADDQRERQAVQLREQEEAHKLSLDRRLEDDALADARREEDLKRSLAEQLADIKINQGDIEGATTESLLAQASEYANTFGPDGTVTTTMNEFFAQQLGRLDELAQEAADAEREAQTSESSTTSGGFGSRLKQESLKREELTLGDKIGQRGLVTQSLSSPIVSIPNASPSSAQTVNTNNQSSISMDLRGAEPLIQSIAARTALEIVQNTFAGAGA